MDDSEQSPTTPGEVEVHASDTGHPAAAGPTRKRRVNWRLMAVAGVLAGVSRVLLARRRQRRGRS
jgi:hypothetical protein